MNRADDPGACELHDDYGVGFSFLDPSLGTFVTIGRGYSDQGMHIHGYTGLHKGGSLHTSNIGWSVCGFCLESLQVQKNHGPPGKEGFRDTGSIRSGGSCLRLHTKSSLARPGVWLCMPSGVGALR